MNWDSGDTWTVVVGALCAVACALPGCFLVLRRMSMMGDAISHAVLPGLAIAFLVTSARASVAMFVGAAVVGVLTAVFTQWISRFGKVDRGAAMGIVFTTLFALGLILIRQAADHVDLDPGCVLYGSLENTPLDTVPGIYGVPLESLGHPMFSAGDIVRAPIQTPRAVWIVGSVLLVNIGVIALFFKELRISSFDPELASTLGIPANLIHYLLMTVVAITTVAAFESVGSIIVIAMLIVPPATAFLLTTRLSVMLGLSVVIGILAAILGHVGALSIPPALGFRGTVSSGMMAGAAGFLFVLAWLFSPQQGLLTTRAMKGGLGQREEVTKGTWSDLS